MKILIPCLLLAAFITAPFSGNTQTTNEEFRERLTIGPKAGINIANVYDSQGEDFEADPKVGAMFGLFVAIPIGEYLGVQPEILFSQKGFHGSGSILGGRYEFSRTTNHIDVPLLITFKPAGFITVLAGPNYSYMFNQKDNFESALVNIEQEQEFEDVDIRRNTLGFIGGFDFNLMNFVIGTRVAWDFQTNHGDGTSSVPRYKNTWFQLSLGFRF